VARVLTWLIVGASLALIIGIIYWQFIIAEGAYLGPRIVTLLYDWSAHRYNDIKDLDQIDEALYVADPILHELIGTPYPLVIDVATGTGRLPLALLRQMAFRGQVIGLDLSARMLRVAQKETAPFRQRVDLVRQEAGRLPFANACADAVTCLEALEFVPDPARTIDEIVRVLKPGGLLVITNRIGWESRFLRGRLCGRGAMERHLERLGLEAIDSRRWQVHYDLISARKRTE
jgi:SAM-dependent methyltransferase